MEAQCRYCLNHTCILLNLAKKDFSFHPEEFSQMLDYDKGQTLFQEGTPSYGSFLICSGRVKLARRLLNGKKTLLEILGPGDIIGPTSEGRYRHYAEALEKSRVAYVAQEDFGQLLLRYPHLATALVEKLISELGRLQERLFTTTQSNARAKLAHLLVELVTSFGKEHPEGSLIDMTLSQIQLAEMTGLTRETVSLTLNDFASKGWIKLKQRKIIICKKLELQKSI